MKKITLLFAIMTIGITTANSQLLSAGFGISAGAQQQYDDVAKDSSFQGASFCQFRLDISDHEAQHWLWSHTYASVAFGAGGNKTIGRIYVHASVGLQFFNGTLAVGPTIQMHHKSPAYTEAYEKVYLGAEIHLRYRYVRFALHGQKDYFSFGIVASSKYFD